MKLLSYIVDRDFGFAPNPFHGFCTLATCKPKTRSVASIGDWVLGIGGVNLRSGYRKLIFAMKVTEKLTFDEYWLDDRFQVKKPQLNGSLMQSFGDNIYHQQDGAWIQADSHHSLDNGVVNEVNLKKDTSSNYVLVSEHFYYFGKEFVDIPNVFKPFIVQGGSNHRRLENEKTINLITEWLEENFELNVIQGFPCHFKCFKRYKGENI